METGTRNRNEAGLSRNGTGLQPHSTALFFSQPVEQIFWSVTNVNCSLPTESKALSENLISERAVPLA